MMCEMMILIRLSEGLTFGEGADVFGQRRQTRVVLRGEPITVQGSGPDESVTGQHRSAAVPHGHTHAPARLDEPVDASTAEFRESPSTDACLAHCFHTSLPDITYLHHVSLVTFSR